MSPLSQISPEGASVEHLGFLSNGGEMGALLQQVDWRESPLGHPSSWSSSLKTLMATVLPVKAQIVLFWGPEFVALYNDAYAPSIGSKHPQALGRPGIENWAELWDDLEPLLRGVRETGETFSAKDRPFYIERYGRGETVYFDVSYSAAREADGTVGGVLCIVTETTERVRFERRQALLLELGQALPSITDPDRIEAVAATRLASEIGASRVFLCKADADGAGFSVSQEYRNGTQQIFESEIRFDFGPALTSSLAIGLPVQGESLGRQVASRLGADDAFEPAAALFVPVLRLGKLVAVMAIYHEQRPAFAEHEIRLAEETVNLVWGWINHAAAELALRVSSAQLSAMFDQASAGIAVCGQDGRFIRVNDRYCESVGHSRDALFAMRMQDIVHYPDQHSEDRPNGSVVPFEFTRCYARPDGTSVWLQNHVTPLVDERRGVIGRICVSVDISERIHAEEELRSLNEGLEEHVASMIAQREAAMAQLHEARKMEMVGQLSGGVAHDFNNLLTPIIASLELMRRRSDDERAKRLVDGALQAADRARVLVGRLLTFGRRQTLKPRAVALQALVPDMRDLIQKSLGPMIDVSIDIPAQLPAVFVDPHQLELAILNLAVNARDAMSGEGRLDVVARLDEFSEGAVNGLCPGRYVCLAVGDNGSGMSEETLAHCIEPFYSTKGVGKGTGLGLSMVHGLAAQSGGGFSITSAIGEGTRVSIWLPITDDHVALEHAEPACAPRAPWPIHILLVDDEALVRESTAQQLRHLGYGVSEADSAAAALHLIDSGLVPDVLVTDHIMANKTGAQLAHELRERIPGLPVLIITGYANLTPEQIGGFEILAKPFRREEIAGRLIQLVSAKASSS